MSLSNFTLCRPALQEVRLCHFLFSLPRVRLIILSPFLRPDHGIQAAQGTGNLVAKYTLGNWQTRHLLCAGFVFEDLFCKSP